MKPKNQKIYRVLFNDTTGKVSVTGDVNSLSNPTLNKVYHSLDGSFVYCENPKDGFDYLQTTLMSWHKAMLGSTKQYIKLLTKAKLP